MKTLVFCKNCFALSENGRAITDIVEISNLIKFQKLNPEKVTVVKVICLECLSKLN